MSSQGTVIIDAQLNNKPLQQDLSGLGGVIDKSLAGAGISLAAVTAGAVALGTQVYKAGVEFEQSFAKARTLMIGTGVDTKALTGNVLDLSNASGVAAAELNDGLYQALSAGVKITKDGSDALGFMETNTKLTKAGFTDLTTAVDATTTVLNAYGMKQSDVNKVSDILINTQNEGKTTVAELGAVMGQVVPTAANLGLSFEQVGATLAAMTAQGIPTAQAATQIRQALVELSKSGQTASNAFLEASGVSFPQFIAAGGTMQEAMGLMADYANKTGLRINDLFGSVEAANTALVLASDTGSAKFIKSLDTMETNVGATDEAFDIMKNTVGFKMEQAFTKCKNSGIKFFDSVSPMIETGADLLNGLADILGAIPAPIMKIGVAFGAAFIANKATTVIAGMVKGFKETTTAIKAASTASKASSIATKAMTTAEMAEAGAKGAQTTATIGATAAQNGLNAAMAANVIGAVVLAVTALVSVLGDWAEKQKELKEAAWSDFKEKMQENTKSIYDQRDATIAANTETRTWEERLAELQGIDINTPVNVEVQGAYEELDDIKSIFFDIASGGDQAKEAINRLCEAVDKWIDKQKEARNEQFSEELWDLAEAYNAGTISADKYVAACDDVKARSDAYNSSMDDTAQKLKDVKDGTLSGREGYLALAESIGVAGSTSAELAEQQISSVQAAQDLQDALARGDGTESLKIKTEALNEALIREASFVQNDITAAYENYQTATDAATQALQSNIDHAYQEMDVCAQKEEAYGRLSEIYGMYAQGAINKATMLQIVESDGLTAINNEYMASAAERGVTTEEMYSDLIGIADGYRIQRSAVEENLNADLAVFADERNGTLTDADRQAAMDRNGIYAQYANDVLSAEQQLGNDITASTSGWSSEQIQQLNAWMNNSKVPIDGMTVNTVQGLFKMTGKASETLKTGGATNVRTYTTELNKILPDLDRLTVNVKQKSTEMGSESNTAFKDGIDSNRDEPIDAAGDVGEDTAEAYAAGVRRNTPEAIQACVDMAMQSYKAAKDALGQKSPTGIWRDDLGKDTALAYGYGTSENMDAAFDMIQESIKTGTRRVARNLEVAQVIRGSVSRPQVITQTTDKGVNIDKIVIERPVETPSEIARATRREVEKIIG